MRWIDKQRNWESRRVNGKIVFDNGALLKLKDCGAFDVSDSKDAIRYWLPIKSR